MRASSTPVLVLACLALAVPTASATDSSAAPCDPDAGPFDPCASECHPDFERVCNTVNGAGGAVWKCVFGPSCLVASAEAAALDAAVPCPDGSLGRLFCAITEAVNDYCEEEFGTRCLD